MGRVGRNHEDDGLVDDRGLELAEAIVHRERVAGRYGFGEDQIDQALKALSDIRLLTKASY